MKKLFYILAALGCSISMYAQAPNIQWQKSLGGSNLEWAKSIKHTTDGGYIVAGHSSSTDGDVTGNHSGGQLYMTDYWIVKLNSSGGIQWQKSLGGNSIEEANSIQQTNDGGYIIAGTAASSDGDVTGSHGSFDYWIVKLDSSGNIQWEKTFGGDIVEQAYSIQQTADNGYIIAGYTNSSNGDVTVAYGEEDFWIIKLDQTGNLQWQKSYGSNSKDYAYSIQQTTEGGYIVAGSTNSIIGGISYSDCLIMKLNSSGDLQWQKKIGGSHDDYATAIKQTIDGGYIVAGNSNSTDGDATGNSNSPNIWIFKLNNTGDIQWKQFLGGTGYDGASSVELTSDNGYLIGGTTTSSTDLTDNFYVAKLNATGSIIWEKSLGGSATDQLNSAIETADGGFILAGNTDSNDGDVSGNHSDGFSDFWIVKLMPTTTLATAEVKANQSISFFPNPAKEFINIRNLPDGSVVTITDTSGRKLLSKNYHEDKVIINTSQLIPGIYMIQIENKGKIILNEKLILKK
ncbi:T9SS type A sorting domain-containing protein [Chryseobacterium rhizosphaerae]|uniref:T9SS type A sorting domain-containing protein n=1 Tax=Chryseobacterium rhizosphaerae TaxID=395937 RepID=UPI002359FF6E|nr:T9SS type A sorting domain-containing protein [Chryseobacterium rhizosphaerae]MDC8098345.1 T9SS type A sorting domain-containing protein [Chryseobacterium rhizosphaerae]